MIKAIIFDWGDTVMRDYPELDGPMYSWDNVEWIPGTEKSLKLLSRKFICCIATNAGCSNTGAMIKALKRINADKYFKYFFSSKDLGYEKPDKRFFLNITKNINVKPKECFMIGNDYEKDIVGAKAVGMKTIFFNEKSIKGNFPVADFIIYSMDELSNIILNYEF